MAWPKPIFAPRGTFRETSSIRKPSKGGRPFVRGVYLVEAAVALTLLLVTISAVAKYVAVAQQARTEQWRRLSDRLAAENVASQLRTVPFADLEAAAETIQQAATRAPSTNRVKVAIRSFDCQGVPCKEIRVAVSNAEPAQGDETSVSQTVQIWRFKAPPTEANAKADESTAISEGNGE